LGDIAGSDAIAEENIGDINSYRILPPTLRLAAADYLSVQTPLRRVGIAEGKHFELL
jgi:hypothetical protein